MESEKLKILQCLRSGELKLIKPQGSSTVWDRFMIVVDATTSATVGDGFAQCMKCKKLLSFNQSWTGTSGLKRHNCIKTSTVSQVFSASTLKSFVTITPTPAKKTAAKQQVLQACVTFCSKDLRPFEVVRGEGFRVLAKSLVHVGSDLGNVDIEALLPSPQTIGKHISLEAEKLRHEICPFLQDLICKKFCAATTDMWSDDYRKTSYTTVTVHYIDRDWVLKNRVLFTCAFPYDQRKTGVNIRAEIERRFTEFGFNVALLSALTFVTDQGPNVVAALQPYTRLSCCAHVLNTVLRNTFDSEFLQSKANNVITTFNATKALVAHFKHAGLTVHLSRTLNQEVETRWNSRLAMLKSVHGQLTEIRGILSDRDDEAKLNNIDIAVMESLIAFLEPFKQATDLLEMDKNCTLPFALLWYDRLLKHLQHERKDSKIIKVLKTRAEVMLKEKFIITSTHKISTFLHPTFKELVMISEADRKEVYTDVRSRLIEDDHLEAADTDLEMDVQPSTSQSTSDEPSTLDGFGIFNRLYGKVVPATAQERDEVQNYLNMVVYETFETPKDVLLWWKAHVSIFPKLAKLVCRVYCIPASSASSERNFSSAGFVVQERRTCLKPERVNDILFLHNNRLEDDEEE